MSDDVFCAECSEYWKLGSEHDGDMVAVGEGVLAIRTGDRNYCGRLKAGAEDEDVERHLEFVEWQGWDED